ncbi:MAG: hypothetical protein ACOX5R_10685 [bacterium]|jgi:hypothetical protein
MNRRSSGKILIIIGCLFPFFFLLGGGFVTATHALYWCSLFIATYLGGMVFPGLLVYRSALHTQMPEPHSGAHQSPMLIFIIVGIKSVAFILWNMFIRSDFFTTSLGLHSFTILIALGLSQIPMIGLGHWYSVSASTEEGE